MCIERDRVNAVFLDKARGSSEAVIHELLVLGIHGYGCPDVSSTLQCLVWVRERVIHFECRTNGGVCVTTPDRTCQKTEHCTLHPIQSLSMGM